MPLNTVSVTSDTSTLTLTAAPVNPADPAVEFATGSFKGTVDERRVVALNLAVTGNRFRLRLEFTDPTFATVDLWGEPIYLTQEDRIAPYRERDGQTLTRKNPDAAK